MREDILLVTATVYDDATHLAYSIAREDGLTPIHYCPASREAWGYLQHTLPDSGGLAADHRLRICVIDRRPGTRATSRSQGISRTSRFAAPVGVFE